MFKKEVLLVRPILHPLSLGRTGLPFWTTLWIRVPRASFQ